MGNKKKGSEAIKVVVRIRPLSSKEIQDNRNIATKAYEDRGSIEVHSPASFDNSNQSSEQAKQFSFDAVFSERATQRKIYDTCAAPVVQSVLEGYNGTIFAYGQTGAGKTHTMEGVPNDKELRGIIPNAFQQVFDHVALKGSDETYLVRASYFEIYNEEIRDLLSSNPKASLELKESADTGIYVKNLTSKVVKSFPEIDSVMQAGKKNRSVGATLMNQGSSRSHSVFVIVVECCSKDQRGEEHIRVGKLNLVDLAGSERQGKTGATGDRLKEATKINLSLSALGNVISALVDGKTQHVPYRDSKLTRILQDSLGGNTKTVMCANAGPAEYNYDETISTLRYANRAKNIKNKPVINEDPKDATLREYQDEISKLKAQLSEIQTSTPALGIANHPIAESKSTDEERHVNDEKLRAVEEQAEKEKAEIMARSKEEMNKLRTAQNETTRERKMLEAKLDEESKVRTEIDKQRVTLQRKLQDMEAQLMIGGEIVDKAAKQDAALRKAEQDLIAKKEKELVLARQMAEKEEANFQLNEKYSSLQEEAQSKTKKLKKLWIKYQQAKNEIEDLNCEFEEERNDMLETIRDLTKQMKLKDLIIANFIPPKYNALLNEESKGGIAKWQESNETWVIPRLDLAGNNIKPIITSVKDAHAPESDFAKYKKQQDSNPRWRQHNAVNLNLHTLGNMSQTFDGTSSESNVTHVLNMDIEDDDEYVHNHNFDVPGNPYMRLSEVKNNKRRSKGK